MQTNVVKSPLTPLLPPGPMYPQHSEKCSEAINYVLTLVCIRKIPMLLGVNLEVPIAYRSALKPSPDFPLSSPYCAVFHVVRFVRVMMDVFLFQCAKLLAFFQPIHLWELETTMGPSWLHPVSFYLLTFSPVLSSVLVSWLVHLLSSKPRTSCQSSAFSGLSETMGILVQFYHGF